MDDGFLVDILLNDSEKKQEEEEKPKQIFLF